MSDLHLRRDNPRTIHALDEILRIGKKEKVDLLTIDGDMFDSSEDANDLRSELPGKLSSNNFEILVIPGNHDINAFTQNTFYGNDVKLLIHFTVQVEEYDDVAIFWGSLSIYGPCCCTKQWK